MCARIAQARGARVIAVDLVPERLEMARRNNIKVLNLDDFKDIAQVVRDMTLGGGTTRSSTPWAWKRTARRWEQWPSK